MTGVQNAKGNSLGFSYDERHNVKTMYRWGYPAEQYTRDGNGNVLTSRDRAGGITSFTYDDNSRLTNISYPYMGWGSVGYGYFPDDRVQTRTDATGTYSWTYNGLGKVATSYQPVPNKTVTYAYDGSGRKKQVSFGGQTLTYNYNDANQIISMEATAGYALPATFEYYDNGLLRLKGLGNSTRTYYAYDLRGRTTYTSHRKVVGGAEQEQGYLQYAYDGASNVSSYQEVDTPSNVSWTTTYFYDYANRLTNETRTGTGDPSLNFSNIYLLDNNGNRSQVTRNGSNTAYNVTDADRLTSGDGYTFQNYDVHGNPGTIVGPTGTLGLTYKWFDKVTQITPSSGPINTFLYDGAGRRVSKTDSQGTTKYVYDGSTIIGEVNAGGTFTAYYTPGVGFVYPSGDVRGFYQENDLGSTLAATDNTGNRADRYMYDAFGITYTLQQNVYTPHKFAGGQGYYSDGDTGMLLLGQRYYLPKLGRFLTEDPIGIGGGLNLYGYAGNNPVTMADPGGTHPVPPQATPPMVYNPSPMGSIPEPETPGYAAQAWGFFKGELRAANPINWVKGLYNAGCIIKQRGWDGASDVAVGMWEGLQFWNAEEPGEAGERFMGFMLTVAPVVKRIPNPFKANCFVAGTPVQTVDADGQPISTPIEQIRPGDHVLARDEGTGRTSARRVTGTSVRTVDTVWRLALSTDASGAPLETLTTTAGHPFYVAGRGFTLAGDLREGDRVVTRRGSPLVVRSLASERRSGGYRVYNLEVEEDHTYFVGNEGGGVWVHNNSIPLVLVHAEATIRGTASYSYWKTRPR
jgi:RHS repeat-associated protein